MALPTPFICERIGAPLFLGIILIIWGCTATIFAFITSSWQFLILRFLLGIAESGAYPGINAHYLKILMYENLGSFPYVTRNYKKLSNIAIWKLQPGSSTSINGIVKSADFSSYHPLMLIVILWHLPLALIPSEASCSALHQSGAFHNQLNALLDLVATILYNMPLWWLCCVGQVCGITWRCFIHPWSWAWRTP